jgi:sulfide dehydrogenase [flavocytochrome c] flavoprotein chain
VTINAARRRFLQTVGGGLLLSGCQTLLPRSSVAAQVVVVGGGFAGATCANYLKRLQPDLRVALIDSKTQYQTCPGSNWLLAGLCDWSSLSFDYAGLRSLGVETITDAVQAIDRERRRVRLAQGEEIHYDRLVIAPGISFREHWLDGYQQESALRFPHAWQAGPQTDLLKNQLQAMPNGGVVIISVPADPYRCPPGPYERASLIAWWLKQHKPRSKVLILDAKRSFSKQALFEHCWREYFGYQTDHALIEWHSLADNRLLALDARQQTLISDFGDRFRGDILNIIPPQQAGTLALSQQLTDRNGWCAVHADSAQSIYDAYIHVIGDAASMTPMPKSAFAANSAAKNCAVAIVQLLHDQTPAPALWMNTCYSLITPDSAVSVAGAYRADAGQMPELIAGSGGVSSDLSPSGLAQEAVYAKSVLHTLCADSFNSING